jgi:anti-anti-sigma factor
MECTFETNHSTLSVKISGQFLFTDHNKFRSVLSAAEDPGVNVLQIDLSGVDFIDSAGLGMLLLLRDQCEKASKSLQLSGAAGQVKKVFDISKFEHLFSIVP